MTWGELAMLEQAQALREEPEVQALFVAQVNAASTYENDFEHMDAEGWARLADACRRAIADKAAQA